MGQIGTALRNILECDADDYLKNIRAPKLKYKILHICFPCKDQDEFIRQVKLYQERFNPKFTVIHSTVPIGTSRLVGAIHSPCRGVHPHLEESLQTFVKFFGGRYSSDVAQAFMDKRIPIKWVTEPEVTEALKLWDTTIYGWNIMLEKEIHRFCQKNGVDFDIVYRLANETYNIGYREIGNPEYTKFILKETPGKIGGHCIVPNLDLLNSPIAEILKNYNADL